LLTGKGSAVKKTEADSAVTDRPIKRGNFDIVLCVTVLIVCAVGVIMVYSSSYYDASTNASLNNNMSYYAIKELVFVGIGTLFMLGAAYFPYPNYQKFSSALYVVALVPLVVVLIKGKVTNGASRWIFGIQPSELAKVVLILYLADRLGRNPDELDDYKGMMADLIRVFIPIALIAKENLSTAIITSVVMLGMMLIVVKKWWRFVPVFLMGGIAVACYVKFGDEFRGARFAAWLDPYAYADGAGYQILQGLYAIGSGGFFGVGLGNSRQKLGFIPESHNDIIFAVICEELGLVGASIIILLYMIIVWRCVEIAMNATTFYGTLIATGVAIMIGAQVVVNVAVVTNSMPNTGIPLPFISYGGSSMITLMTIMGIVLNISRHYRDDD
jgi:cell division protein FtsW